MQISVLIWRRLAPVHGARRHIIDELVVLGGEPLLLPLAVTRDFGPFERAVGVAEGAGAVLLAFRRPHTLGVAFDAGAFDRSADLLLVGFAQAATAALDVIGKRVKALVIGLQQARDGAQRGKGLAPAVRRQQADRFAKLGGEFVWERHGLPPPRLR